MQYPDQIRQAMLDAGCPPDQVDTTPPQTVFEFMLRAKGLQEWVAWLNDLVAATVAQDTGFDVPVEGTPLPDNLGLVVDMYKEASQARLDAEKAIKPLKAYESSLKEHLIQNIAKSDTSGAIGNKFKAVIQQDRKPRIGEDGWQKFYTWVQQTGRFDLLQKRLNDKAIMDMHEQGEMPDGVETLLVPKISVTKI